MLVDLGRNDLGRVSEYGSVTVDELMEVETYSHVLHIVSQVSGTPRARASAPIDALRATLPAGTLSGAPEGAGDGDHRRARAPQALLLRRRDRLPGLRRRPRHGDPHPHRRRQGRRGSTCRPGAAPSPTPSPTTSTRRASTRRPRSSAPSSWRRQPELSAEPVQGTVSRRSAIGCDREGPRHRQLRLVHLQPRPVPGRAGRGGRGRPQRRRGRWRSCSSGARSAW